jgi:hypothetical protein
MPLFFIGLAHQKAQPAIKRPQQKGDSHDEWSAMVLVVDP